MLKNGPKYGKCSSISRNANIFTLGKTHPDTQYIMSVDKHPTEEMPIPGEKDLDVISDEKLIFRDHIFKKTALANRNLGLIFRSLIYIDKVMFLNLYKSQVGPHLEYATDVQKDSITPENVQRRATRLVNSL